MSRDWRNSAIAAGVAIGLVVSSVVIDRVGDGATRPLALIVGIIAGYILGAFVE